MEAVYRWQLVDTYSPELRAFTPAENFADDGRPVILIMGDSFTVGRASYPRILQDSLPKARVVNAGVGGTGVIQALVVAGERFRAFHPSIFIYQVYVGNDLFDIRYPVNWRALPVLRNLYWLLAERFRSLHFLNYRVAQIVQSFVAPPGGHLPVMEPTPGATGAFSVERYDARVKLFLKAEPTVLDDSIRVKGRRAADYEVFLAGLERLIAFCRPGGCRAYVLVIPHACQVAERYLDQVRQLAAVFTEPGRIGDTDYPFVAGIAERFRHRPEVRIVNALGRLKTVDREQPVYFSTDEHLTRAGQQAIADLLLEQLDVDRLRGTLDPPTGAR